MLVPASAACNARLLIVSVVRPVSIVGGPSCEQKNDDGNNEQQDDNDKEQP